MNKLNIDGLNKHREQTVKDILKLLKTNNRVGCVRYTGYGKSYFIVKNMIHKLNENVLIVVPNNSLCIDYEHTYRNYNNVKVLSYQKLRNIRGAQLEEIKDYKYVIADECHHLLAPKWGEEFNRIEDYLQAKVIGLTATPTRGDGKNVIDKYFNEVQVIPLELIDGIINRYVNKIKYVIAYANIDDKYDDKLNELDRYKVKNLLNVENILKKYIPKNKLNNNLKIPVYVSRVEFIEETKEQCYNWFHKIYPDKNINIYSVSSKDTSTHINKTLKKFKAQNSKDDIDILVSIDMLKERITFTYDGCRNNVKKNKITCNLFSTDR